MVNDICIALLSLRFALHRIVSHSVPLYRIALRRQIVSRVGDGGAAAQFVGVTIRRLIDCRI